MLIPAGVGAQDSEAPAGASVRWLPCERWVMLHWLPYEERDLFRMLRVTRAEAQDWMSDDQHHTFAQLARRRGSDPEVVARRLVARWTRGMSERRRSVLRARALRTLTQGHLSQHVFFHVFHHPEVGAHASAVFGTTPMSYLTLRRSGYTPAEIGGLGGRSRAQTGRAIERVWRATARRGARRLQTPPAQARRFADHQARMLSPYLDSALHPKQPGAPPPPSTMPTPVPHLRLLCTIFAGASRASNPINYGRDAARLVLRSGLGRWRSPSVVAPGNRPTPCNLGGDLNASTSIACRGDRRGRARCTEGKRLLDPSGSGAQSAPSAP